MAARLIVGLLRSCLFSVGQGRPHRWSWNSLAGDGPEAISSSGLGLQTYCPTHDVSVLAKSSSTTSWWRVQHSRTLFGMSNLNLSDSSRGRVPPAPGIAFSPGQKNKKQDSDEWLVQRALADRRRRQIRQKICPIHREDSEDVAVPFGSLTRKYISPVASEEEILAGVVGRPDLIVTRNVEWANLTFGFEQQNKYVIIDPREPQSPVGYILEESNILIRQVLRRRRPFVAQILDTHGNEVCSVHRPIWLINSTIFVEMNGKVIGEVHRRWHLWRRVYDCYLGMKQFAAVDNPGFWYWTFTLHDENQGVLAVIDRTWRGFGFEVLTDAGQYVVHFGDIVSNYAQDALKPQPPFDDARLTGQRIQQLQAAAKKAERRGVVCPLSLSERAVVLALAVSLDNDYFSNHSSGFGFIPLPFFGGPEEFIPAQMENTWDSESSDGYWANYSTDGGS